MLAKLFTAAAIASLAAAPVVAAPASSLSIAKVATKGKKTNGVKGAIIIGVLATAAVIGGAVALANSDDTPDSP